MADDVTKPNDDNQYYADDVNAQDIADSGGDDSDFTPTEEDPITTGNITVGDMDEDITKIGDSEDEENDYPDLVQDND